MILSAQWGVFLAGLHLGSGAGGVVPLAPGGCACAVGVLANTDYNGHDLPHSREEGSPGFNAWVSDSPLNCCELCAVHDECVWWQQSPPDVGRFSNQCWLKSKGY